MRICTLSSTLLFYRNIKRKAGAIALSMGLAAGTVHAQEPEEATQKPWQVQSVALIRKGNDESLAEAAALIKKEAEAGNATAQMVLALRYIVGAGVEKNREEAEKLLKNAADQNSRDAQWLYSYCCKNREEAVKYAQAAADSGHSGAQSKMGRLCAAYTRPGSGERKDPEGAFRWFSKAAEQKDPMGLAGLGECYCLGVGVEKDSKGYDLYEQAAALGDVSSMGFQAYFSGAQWNPQSRGEVQVKDNKGRQRLFADAGCKNAISNLSNCYMTGWGVPRDMEAALYWRIKAVEKGDAFMERDMVALSMQGDLETAVKKEDPLAMFLKGFLQQMELTLYTNHNMEEIIALYEKAAKKKHSHAQYRLALCHEMGMGVEANAQEAAKWYRMAAEQGHAEAQYRLARCYEKLGQGKQYKETAKWYTKAANQGHAQAQYRLGLCFLYGKGGVPKKDAKAAAKWFRMAADRFDIGGLYEMGMMHYTGKGAKKDRKEALRFLTMAGESYGPLCLENEGRKLSSRSGYAKEWEEDISRANADALSILYLLRSLKK